MGKDKKPERELLIAYPGLPPGAGIYDDGKFYTNFPGHPFQEMYKEADEEYYHVDPETQQLIFNRDHICYKHNKAALARAGIDLDACQTPEEIESHRAAARETITEYVLSLPLPEPEPLMKKFKKAIEEGRKTEAKRLGELITRQWARDFQVVRD